MIITGGVQYYNQKFLDAAEFMDSVIQDRAQKHPNFWHDRTPRGSFENFQGLVRKSHKFHGGLGDQRGLQRWNPIQISRVASGEDEGWDACQYNPYTVSYAFETVQYSGHETSRQTMPICLKDIRWTWEGRQQCELIMSFLSYITMSVWENAFREWYIKHAVDAGNAFILTDGGLDYTDDPTMRFTYDPFSVDSDGDNVITFPQNTPISTLNWSYFDWWQDYLGDQCPDAALANSDGLPVFGLGLHKRDFNKMVMSDSDLREDYRHARSSVLIADYRKFTEFKGWSLLHDMRQMRFKIKSVDGTTVTAKRVAPFKLGEAVTIGNKPVVDPDYNNAELALGVIMMNDVYQALIPPAGPPSPGGGMQFGATPSYNGEFKWINEYDRTLNPLREVGYYFGRYELFPKPLMYSDEAIVFLYRRCPQTWSTECECQCGGVEGSGAIGLASDAASADVDTDNNTVTLTLSSCLPCETGDAIVLSDDDGTTDNGIIADGSLAPTYVLALESAPSAYGKYTAAGAATVTCA